MGGAPAVIQGVVNPGANYDITVGLTAPTTAGYYQGWWQMVNGKNIAFGPRIWVAITVPGTTAPTSTLAPTVPTPTRRRTADPHEGSSDSHAAWADPHNGSANRYCGSACRSKPNRHTGPG